MLDDVRRRLRLASGAEVGAASPHPRHRHGGAAHGAGGFGGPGMGPGCQGYRRVRPVLVPRPVVDSEGGGQSRNDGAAEAGPPRRPKARRRAVPGVFQPSTTTRRCTGCPVRPPPIAPAATPFIGACRPANDAASSSVVKSASNGSGLRAGNTSDRSAASHIFPNLRLSTKRSFALVVQQEGVASQGIGGFATAPALRGGRSYPDGRRKRRRLCLKGERRRYLPRRSTPSMVRPGSISTNSAAEGRLTVLAHPTRATMMVRPGRPARTRVRRTPSTSGSSGI